MKTETPIVILGAGLAGLTAGYLLKKSGRAVCILEARHRLGGRVDTRTSADGFTYEMGGEWIGTKDTYMRALCETFNLPLANHRLTTRFLTHGVYREKDTWEPGKKLAALISKQMSQFPELSEDAARRLQHTDWWQFLMHNHIPQDDIELLDLVRSTDFGEDMRFVPTYDVIYDYVVGGDGADACADRIEGGNARLIQALATYIGMHNIHLGVEVHAVTQTPAGVTAHARNGARYDGTQLIAAIPTFAVSKIEWSPVLPLTQQEAYADITYCRIAKTAVHFSQRFWKDDAYEVVSDRLPHQIYHATQGQPGTSGILMSYATGDKGELLSRMSKKERMQEVCDVLAVPFGNIHALADEVTTYYWGDDPYTAGAYPLFRDDESTRVKKILAVAHARVHFAGEHTARRYAFMEGAVESGTRVVEEVLRSETVY